MSQRPNRRRFRRLRAEKPVMLWGPSSATRCLLLDISVDGARVASRDAPRAHLGERLTLELRPRGGERPIIRMQGKLVHTEQTSLGLQWDSPDVPSVQHLRGFLERELEEPGRIASELRALGRYRPSSWHG